jgi:hypothetical protein
VIACSVGCALDERGIGTSPLLPHDASGVDRGTPAIDTGPSSVDAGDDAGDAGRMDAAAPEAGADVAASDARPGDAATGDARGDVGSAVDVRPTTDGAAGDARDGGASCGACAPCEICTAGSCKIDPASKWVVVCASAELSKIPPPGYLTWDRKTGDLGGADPDPFCEFEMPAGSVTVDTAGVTDTFLDTYTAAWGQTVSPATKTIKAQDLLSPTGSWRLWVGDDEGNGRGQLACGIQQPMQASWLHDGQITFSNLGSCVSLTVKLVCVP